jgi:hypothetical protein
MINDKDFSEKYPNLNLDEAWGMIGEACYAYSNVQARHALMLVRGSVAEMRIFLKQIVDGLEICKEYMKSNESTKENSEELQAGQRSLSTNEFNLWRQRERQLKN